MDLNLPFKCNNVICHKAIENKFKKYLFFAYTINFITTVVIRLI